MTEENKKWTMHLQREILTLEEALNLLKLETNKGNNFLSLRSLLENADQLSKEPEIWVDSTWLRDPAYMDGKEIYAIRKKDNKLQCAYMGYLWRKENFERLSQFIEGYKQLPKLDFPNEYERGIYEKNRSKLVKRNFVMGNKEVEERSRCFNGIKDIPITPNADKRFYIISPEDVTKFVFGGDQTKFAEHIESRKNIDDEYKDYTGRAFTNSEIDKNWHLVVLAMEPRGYQCFEFAIPSPNFLVALEYKGNTSLEQDLMRSIIHPRDIGNGIFAMSQDKIPKYLLRKWAGKGEK